MLCFKIITELPTWYILFCVLLGAGLSYILYRKESWLNESPKWVKWTLTAFRFIVISFICFLLLSPLIKTLVRTVEKPIIVLALDESESLRFVHDSTFLNQTLKKQFEDLADELSETYEVVQYSFGEKLSSQMDFQFRQKITDYSILFDEIQNRYVNRNIGAIILATDGIYNKGSNPVYSIKENMPIYTVALGDTTQKRDLILQQVSNNKITYLGNKFPVRIGVKAHGVSNESSNVIIKRNDKELFRQAVQFSPNKSYYEIDAIIEAKEVGLQTLKVYVEPIKGELTEKNNYQIASIDVLDGRQKILLLANSPHPDIAALKRAIETNENYEVISKLAADFNEKLNDYNLVILHQLPSMSNSITTTLQQIEQLKIPVLYVLGNQSDVRKFSQVNKFLNINGSQSRTNDAIASFNKDFPLFSISEEYVSVFKKFPPLQTPFGNYNSTVTEYPLFKQQIGIVSTKLPLISFYVEGETKAGVIAGDGIWRWSLENYRQKQNHLAFNEIIGKTVQYLSVKADKSRFKVEVDNQFFENDIIQFEAELYNESYELTNEPEVKLVIKNKDGKAFNYSFGKTSNAYVLNIGTLPVGEYTYFAKTSFSGKDYTDKGEFIVKEIQLEEINLQANHTLLQNLAEKTNGGVVYPKDINTLGASISENNEITSISFSEEKLFDLINLKWIFFLLLIALSAEWLLRKRYGSY
mgnify:CR=1 FL=1